ncbi:MAG TPA: hypothetical protein VJG83_05625 [archaeon]|nr:hypothetical protein [archaeon]
MRDEPMLSEHFWTSDRILLVLVFAVGLVVGIFAASQINLGPNSASDYNSLVQINERLDSRNDSLYSCLIRSDIDPINCSPK